MDEVRQLVVHPAMWDGLVAFLRGRGLDVMRFPTDENDLPTYLVTPTDALMRAANAPAPAREQADPADEEILPRIGPPGPERLDDGHGGLWEKCNRGPACGLQIVRPGKVQCWCDNEADR